LREWWSYFKAVIVMFPMRLSPLCRNDKVDPFVIARSASDEAIQKFLRSLDCFAEPVIGPARGPHRASATGCPASGRTRWLAMTGYAALACSAIATSERKISVAPLRRAAGESHSSKNTTFMSGRTRAPAGWLAI
jgi:hypothetical protein